MPCSSPLPWIMSTGGMLRSMPKGVPGSSRRPSGAYTKVAICAPSSMGTRSAATGGMLGRA